MTRFLIALTFLSSLPLILACGGGDTNGEQAGAANADPSNAASADQALLQGTWETIRMATAGEDVPQERLAKNTTVTFEGNQMITKRRGETMETWTFSLDPGKSPKQMTIDWAEPGEEEKLSLLIYKIEGDTLTTVSGSRSFPTEFTANTVKGCYLTVRRRIDD